MKCIYENKCYGELALYEIPFQIQHRSQNAVRAIERGIREMDHPGVTKSSALLISSWQHIDSHFSTGQGEQKNFEVNEGEINQ